MQVIEIEEDKVKTAYVEDDFSPDWFSTDYLLTSKWLFCPENAESGVMYFSPDGRYEYELRKSKRKFWRGANKVSAWQEFELLVDLAKKGVPAPRPVAVQITRSGLFYTAALIRYRLAETDTLEQRLFQGKTSQQMWQQTGAMLRQFHDLGISIPNISAQNIVINSLQKMFFTDFSKVVKPAGGSDQWKHRNLENLLQSLLTAREKNKHFAFEDSDWLDLTKAYISRARPMAE